MPARGVVELRPLRPSCHAWPSTPGGTSGHGLYGATPSAEVSPHPFDVDLVHLDQVHTLVAGDTQPDPPESEIGLSSLF